jgi:hypothetical protein
VMPQRVEDPHQISVPVHVRVSNLVWEKRIQADE